MKRISRYLFTLTLLCWQLSCFVFAKQSLIIDNSTINKADIRYIEQDFLGNFWLTTTAGLYRFDGINFNKITTSHLPGLAGSSYFEITSNNEYIWLVSEVGLEQISIKDQNSQHLYNGPVSHLQLDEKGQIWFISQGIIKFFNLIIKVVSSMKRSNKLSSRGLCCYKTRPGWSSTPSMHNRNIII